MAERKRRGGGRSARQVERLKPKSQTVPYIKRNIPVYNLLNEEGLSQIENNADTILQEIGIDFRGDPEALEILKDAGADVKEERVRFPKGMCQSLIRDIAPKEFIQHQVQEVVAFSYLNFHAQSKNLYFFYVLTLDHLFAKLLLENVFEKLLRALHYHYLFPILNHFFL